MKFYVLTLLYLGVDSYIFKSENLSLTLMSPLTLPSPLRGEGKGEGKFQICLARFHLTFGF
jgi:hypothetical protein